MKKVRILGIETSCDETAAAILNVSQNGSVEILAETLSSQIDIHKEYGGVVPELASRAHLSNIPLIVDEVLRSSELSFDDLEAIGVTTGPGLKGCLLVGVGYAKGLAFARGLPLIGTHHIEGHILAPMMDNPGLCYPFLALVVSGGHTEIVLVRSLAEYEVVARTIDDAAGEAFDKSANLLGIDYPGGPVLAEMADSLDSTCALQGQFQLPKVMREADGFSFSGLKTAISLLIKRERAKVDSTMDSTTLDKLLAYSIQDSIVDALVFKLKKAILKTGIKRVAVTGGVSANRCLRTAVEELSNVEVYFPNMQHCMDNAAMIAYTAGMRHLNGYSRTEHLDVTSRWPLETLSV